MQRLYALGTCKKSKPPFSTHESVVPRRGFISLSSCCKLRKLSGQLRFPGLAPAHCHRVTWWAVAAGALETLLPACVTLAHGDTETENNHWKRAKHSKPGAPANISLFHSGPRFACMYTPIYTGRCARLRARTGRTNGRAAMFLFRVQKGDEKNKQG